MDFLNKLDLRPATVVKVAILAVGGIIVIAFAFQMIGSSLRPSGTTLSLNKSMGSAGNALYDIGYGVAQESADSAMPELSARNIAPVPPIGDEVITGNTAEDFEVKEFDATIETRDLEGACTVVAGLKAKDYVIFENANEYDRGCNYAFKVERDKTEEILNVLNSLDPKTLAENVRTIKRQIDDFTSEEEILKKKLATIEDTLNDAITAYDEISRVATQARDAESLAKIIDSKIKIIERLTQDRINVTTQLDRLSRTKADQLDRLEYTNFRVSIYENKYIDGENLKDSWKAAIKKFVLDTNRIVQELSIGLAATILLILQYALYIILLVIAAKYGWRLAKYIWNK